MELTIPDQLPQLALGFHEEGSGMACIMNAISYINGDKQISDMPNCVFAPLAQVAQALNDSICGEMIIAARDGLLLCPQHTHMMWLYGARLIGTGETARQVLGSNPYAKAKLTVRLALWAIGSFKPTHPPTLAKMDMAQQWLDGKMTAKQVRARQAAKWCENEDHCPTEDEACHLARTLMAAIGNTNAGERMGTATTVLSDTVTYLDTDEEKMTFGYDLLAEFDRLTDREHLHQWTPEEFTLVTDQAKVPLVSLT